MKDNEECRKAFDKHIEEPTSDGAIAFGESVSDNRMQPAYAVGFYAGFNYRQKLTVEEMTKIIWQDRDITWDEAALAAQAIFDAEAKRQSREKIDARIKELEAVIIGKCPTCGCGIFADGKTGGHSAVCFDSGAKTIATQAAYIAELREALEKVNKVEQSHCYENYLSKTSTKKYVVEARFDLQQCGDIARAVLAKPAP